MTGRSRRKKKGTDASPLNDAAATPSEAVEMLSGVVTGSTETVVAVVSDTGSVAASDSGSVAASDTGSVAASDTGSDAASDAIPTERAWQPTMPTIAPAPSVPWRRPAFTAMLPAAPTLVIDDAAPEIAEREQERRAAVHDHRLLSFLPPILLDRDDRSARQGGLTLAVIILLIAATLTLSYLMRHPNAAGDGVTRRESVKAMVPDLALSSPDVGLASPRTLA
jgi:hypothetical protein